MPLDTRGCKRSRVRNIPLICSEIQAVAFVDMESCPVKKRSDNCRMSIRSRLEKCFVKRLLCILRFEPTSFDFVRVQHCRYDVRFSTNACRYKRRYAVTSLVIAPAREGDVNIGEAGVD